MNSLPVPSFAEALYLGSQTPLCRGTFIGNNGSGCLITAAVRACGVTVRTTEDVLRTAYKLWPWLLTQVMPIENPTGDCRDTVGVWELRMRTIILAECPYHQIQAPVLLWIIAGFDSDDRPGPPLPTGSIIAQIRELEEYVTTPKAEYLRRVNAEVEVAA